MKNWFVVAALVFVPSAYAQQPLTARDVVQRIRQNIGVPWTEPTVDTFKDGDPATPVTGATSLSHKLGWDRYRSAESEFLYRVPETTLAELASTIRRRLPAPTLRVVGDPNLRVSKIVLVPGAAGFDRHRQALRQDVEVLVIGEAREWETVEYVADEVTAGQKKALIILGHIPSEQDGMEEFARWLGTFVRDVPVVFVPTADPFWAPR